MSDGRKQHQPTPGTDCLHDLGGRGAIPPDVYEHPDWYAWGEPDQIRAAHRVIQGVRSQPAAMVTIYRAVPPGVRVIRTGDWVTIVEGYARQHSWRSNDPADDWPVIAARVEAQQVRTGGGDIIEWGYWGPEIPAAVVV